jgi:O-antigen/teichoic acid export membrane protein
LAEYAAAFTFIGLLDQPLAVLSRVFLVTFANGVYTEVEQYRRVSSLNLVLISTMGMAVSILSVFFTPIVFTDEYQMTPMLVTILSTAFVFKAVEVFNTALTIAKDYPQANRNAKFWSTGLYLPLALFLVLRFDVVGAAWGHVAFWAGYALVHALYMRRRLPGHASFSLRQMVVATVLYIGLTWATWALNLGWFALLAVPLYLGGGQLLRLWDLTLVLELMRRLLASRSPLDSVSVSESSNVSD